MGDHRAGSIPALGTIFLAPVAQLDRASDYGSEGYGFDSCRARHEYIQFGALAQLGERLPCTQEVSGSIPLVSTII